MSFWSFRFFFFRRKKKQRQLLLGQTDNIQVTVDDLCIAETGSMHWNRNIHAVGQFLPDGHAVIN